MDESETFVSESNRKEISQSQSQMLEDLSSIPELRVKNQQKSDLDLTKEQKHDVLKNIFVNNPLQFLTRFGEHLEMKQLECFEEFSKDLNISFYLNILKKNNSSEARKFRAKNRRYAALQKLVDITDYFTEEEMQRRNPILFDQLIGKYHTKQERESFLARSQRIAANSSKTPLTDLLMAHIERNEEGESYRRIDQEQQKADEDAADEEYKKSGEDDEEMDEDDEPSNPRGSRNLYKQNPPIEHQDGEEIEEEEKELFKEEFFTSMYRDFLEGRDEDFDYSTVDNNEEYDVGENLEQDEEDAYFQDEEPCEVNSESNSEIDEQFQPPVRSSEIEYKINALTVTSPSTNESFSTDSIHMDDNEDEDELDAYMRKIDKEIQNQK